MDAQKKKWRSTKEKRKLNKETILRKEVETIGEYSLEAGVDRKD